MNKILKLFALFTLIFVLTACDSPEEKHQKYIKKGDEFFAAQDYVHARLEYKNAAKIDPINPEVIYKLGLVEEAQGNLQAALMAFLSAEQQSQDYKPVVQKLAEFFLTAQQDEEAKVRVHRLLALDPQNSIAHALNASIYLKRNNLEAAEAEVQEALALDKENVLAYTVLVGIRKAQKNMEGARNALKEGIYKNPNDISLYLLSAILNAEENDMVGVRESYEKIFLIKPEAIRFRFDLAQIFAEGGDKKAAQEILNEATRIFPDNKEARLRLIRLIEQNEGVSAAESTIKGYLQKTPENLDFYIWLADLYLRNKQEKLAVEALEKVLGISENEEEGLAASTSIAQIRLGQGEIETADKLIKEVLKKDANNNEALYLGANLNYHRGDTEKALADLRNVVRDNPTSGRAVRLMVEILVSQKRLDLAIDTLLQYQKQAPDDLGAQVRLAQLYALRGDKKPAENILKAITQNQPNFALAWETLVRLSIENGSYEEAQSSLDKLQALKGQAAVTKFLQGKLLAAKGDFKAAVQIYEMIVENDPNSPLARHALSEMLNETQKTGDYDNLESFLLRHYANNVSALTLLGGVQVAKGDQESAKVTLRKAIEQKPSSQEPYIALAEIFKHQKDWSGALEILSLAEKDIPNELNASLVKAEVYVSKGDIDQALKIYEKVLNENTFAEISNVAANNYAQIIADHKSNDAEALERARLIAEKFINSENPNYLDTLAWVYYKQGKIEAADPLIRKAKFLSDNNNSQINDHYREILNTSVH